MSVQVRSAGRSSVREMMAATGTVLASRCTAQASTRDNDAFHGVADSKRNAFDPRAAATSAVEKLNSAWTGTNLWGAFGTLCMRTDTPATARASAVFS